jgi:type II secretory pathway component GspD/PulD (secretin)
MVLGGLRKKEVSEQTNKIPLLGDLPLIGFAFKSESEEAIFSEVVVFITPNIVLNPALSEDEQKAYNETEFDGPCPKDASVEKDGDCLWKNCDK